MTREATLLNFQQPVRIPGGRVLPAGTYLFTSVVRPAQAYGVVCISSPDGNVIYATLMTRYVSRSERSFDTELSFAQPREQRQPVILLGWFYPGSFYGHEFVYSERDETRIAEEQHVTILATANSRLVSGRALELPVFD